MKQRKLSRRHVLQGASGLAQVKEHPGRKPLADIKLMKEDAVGAEKQSEEIKARYQKLFHV
jgi:iron(III) transport system substrate-binding protein